MRDARSTGMPQRLQPRARWQPTGDSGSFQSQLLARRKQTDRLFEPSEFGCLLFRGVNPGDVHPPIRRGKTLEIAPRRRVPPKRFLNVLWDLRGRGPSNLIGPLRWRSVQASLRQSAAGLKLRITFAVYRRPSAVRLSGCELASIALLIQPVHQAIDPPKAQSSIQGIVVCDGCAPAVTLVEDEPHLRLRVVMIGEPLPPVLDALCLKRLQSLRGHHTIVSRNWWA